jgi:hypothetical protein
LNVELAMRAVGTLSLVVAAIPVLLIVWKILQVPVRKWIPLLVIMGLFGLVQGCTVLLDPEAITALLYLIAGGGQDP